MIAGAQGFPEPSLVLYGKVVQLTSGSSLQLFEGGLQMTFVNEQNPSNIVTLKTALGPVGEGDAYSYTLTIPQKYLPRSLELGEVLSTGIRPTSFRFRELTVAGFPALPLDGSIDSFTTSFQQRAQQVRLDLRVTLPEVDTDADGLPDWWETQFGLNPNFPDASADKDGDGRTNFQEFKDGTNPNQANTSPLLRTARVRVPERGRAGLLLNLLDSDSSPAQINLTFKSLTAGFSLLRNGTAVSPNATFTFADVVAGRLVVLHQDASLSAGTLAIEFKDQSSPAVPASVEVLVFRASLADGTEASLWLDAYRINATDKSRLAEWRDRSGQNHHAWQPASGQRPEFATNADGRPAVDFAGNQRHFLLEDQALPGGDTTFFAVFDAPKTGNSETILAANRLSLRVQKHSGSVSYPGAQVFTRDDLEVQGRVNVRDRRVVSSVEFTGREGVAFANERFDGLARPTSRIDGPVEPALGLQRRPGLTESERFTSEFEGKIRELLAFPERLDATRRRRITDYLESKWQNATVWDWSDEGSPVSVQGGVTRNIIRGGWGADNLRGGAADDLIAGGPGDDRLAGGGGNDTFGYTFTDTGRDVIEEFTVEGSGRDVLDLSELFAGKTGDARDYLSLRTEAVRVADNLVSRSVLAIKLSPADLRPHQEIMLEGLALNNSDLGRLIGEGVILAGNLTIPVTVTIDEGEVRSDLASTQPTIRVARDGNAGSVLEVPLALSDADGASAGFALAGLGGDGFRPIVRFARGETEKVIPIIPIASSPAMANRRAQIAILPQAEFTIDQGQVEVLLADTSVPSDYSSWSRKFLPADTDPALAAPEADFDHDGASNVSEFIFGTDPAHGESVPRGLTIGREQGRLVLDLTTTADRGLLRFAILHRPTLSAPDREVTASFDHLATRTSEGQIRHHFTLRADSEALATVGFYRAQLVLTGAN